MPSLGRRLGVDIVDAEGRTGRLTLQAPQFAAANLARQLGIGHEDRIGHRRATARMSSARHALRNMRISGSRRASAAMAGSSEGKDAVGLPAMTRRATAVAPDFNRTSPNLVGWAKRESACPRGSAWPCSRVGKNCARATRSSFAVPGNFAHPTFSSIGDHQRSQRTMPATPVDRHLRAVGNAPRRVPAHRAPWGIPRFAGERSEVRGRSRRAPPPTPAHARQDCG